MSKLLSIVAPVFNEEGNIHELCSRIRQSAETLQLPYEIILVDDCSRDASWQIICQEAKQSPFVRGIQFSRNMGEHIAVSAGLAESKGDLVVLMDSDLQDPPEAIPTLYAELQGGYDLVYAVRTQRQHSWCKRQTSALFWLVLRWLTGLSIPSDQATLRIMTGRFRDALCAFPERNRFIHGLSAVVGFRQKGVPVEHGKRMHGSSNYNVLRLLRLAGTGITALSVFPLYISFIFGIITAAVASLFAIHIVIQRLLFHSITEGWSSIMAAIMFMGGIQMMMIGVIGIYIGKNYIETKQRPLYFIANTTQHG